jgi:hypothetical protein
MNFKRVWCKNISRQIPSGLVLRYERACVRELIFHALAPPLPAPPPSSAAGSLFISRFNTRRPTDGPSDRPNIGNAKANFALARALRGPRVMMAARSLSLLRIHTHTTALKLFRVEKLGTLIASWRFSLLNNAPAARSLLVIWSRWPAAAFAFARSCRWTFLRSNFYQRPCTVRWPHRILRAPCAARKSFSFFISNFVQGKKRDGNGRMLLIRL